MAMARMLILLAMSSLLTAFPVEKTVRWEGGDIGEGEEEEEDEWLPVSREADSFN